MRRNKYGNIITFVDGIKFDSGKEAHRYLELKKLENDGYIAELKLQPKFQLSAGGAPLRYDSGRKAHYRADFSYIDNKTGKLVIEDVKGLQTREFKLKKAIVKNIYGIEVVII